MILEKVTLERMEELILTTTGQADSIQSVRTVSGGDINRAYRIQGKSGVYFAKMNEAALYPDLFRLEAAGLLALGSATPAVFGFGTAGVDDFLVMDWIEPSQNTGEAQENLGRLLAETHLKTALQFGLDEDNYIANIRQRNTRLDLWSTFFIENRLQFMLRSASGKGLIPTKIRNDFDRIFERIPGLFDEERPSLLHGDLWSGNYLITGPATPVLIDPAIYYGHREVDIAMTTLFGGFGPEFYAGYQERFPLQPGWQERMSLWNLYPLLVHVNLFGETYLPQLLTHIKKWL